MSTYTNGVANTNTTNIVPVQGTFDQNNNLVNLVGPGGKAIPAAISSVDSYGNPTGIVNPNGGSAAIVNTKQSMLTVACGNSLAQLSQRFTSNTYFNYKSFIHHSNDLSGAPMRFKRIPAYQTTRMDQYGVYGYSGANLGPLTVGGSRTGTILADLPAQWFTPLASAGLVPDFVVGFGLVENDIANGATFAAIVQSLTEWISLVQNTWPNVVIALFTPVPSYNYAQSVSLAKYTVYQQVRSYILSLDNSTNIFVGRGDSLEDPSSPGQAASITANVTFSSTIMTVNSILTPTATSVAFPLMNIGRNSYVWGGTSGIAAASAISVSSQGSGNGGTGTYTLGSTPTAGTYTVQISPYNDAIIHPSARGSVLMARAAFKPLFARMAANWKQPLTSISSNLSLNGSQAVNGTNNTGTMPAGILTISGSSTTGYSQVCTALTPGFQIASTFAAGNGTITTAGTNYMNWVTGSSSGIVAPISSDLSALCVIKLISGSNNFGGSRLNVQVYDGTNAPNIDFYMASQTGDTDPDYLDGDVLTQVSPPIAMTSPTLGFINNFMNSFSVYGKLYGGTCTYQYLNQGAYQTTAAAYVGVPLAATTSSYTVQNFVNNLSLFLQPAGITTCTITGPANPVDGQRLTLTNTGATSYLITLTMPSSFKGGAATLAQYATETFQYSATDSFWYRVA